MTAGEEGGLRCARSPMPAPTDAPGAVAPPPFPPTRTSRAPVQLLGGGTTLLDLMKLDVMRPDRLVDITAARRPLWPASRRRRRACGSARSSG